MLFDAEITARHELGVLERILRVCRHRGFQWHSLRARSDADTVCIELSGSCEKALQLLMRQLEKLDEVLTVQTRPRSANIGPPAAEVVTDVYPHKVYAQLASQ